MYPSKIYLRPAGLANFVPPGFGEIPIAEPPIESNTYLLL